MPESRTTVGRWSPEYWHSHPCWVLYKQGAIPVCISSPKMQSSPKSRKSSARGGKEEGRGQSRTNPQTSSHKGPGGVILGAGGCGKGWVVFQVLMQVAELSGRKHSMPRHPGASEQVRNGGSSTRKQCHWESRKERPGNYQGLEADTSQGDSLWVQSQACSASLRL